MSNLVWVVFNDTFGVRPLPVKEAIFRNNAKPRIASKIRRNEELLNLAQNQGISPVGPENDRGIPETVHDADMVVVGRGAVSRNPTLGKKAGEAAALLRGPGKQLSHLEKNVDASLKHPARARYNLQEWP